MLGKDHPGAVARAICAAAGTLPPGEAVEAAEFSVPPSKLAEDVTCSFQSLLLYILFMLYVDYVDR